MKKRNSSTPDKIIKIVIVGDSGAGKTCLVHRIRNGTFYGGHMCTTIAIDFHTKSVIIAEKTVCLQFWDTAGQERYQALSNMYWKGAEIVLVVYDVTNPHAIFGSSNILTCKGAKFWLNQTLEILSDPIVMIVGSKFDLRKKDGKNEESQEISWNKFRLLFIAINKDTKSKFYKMPTDVSQLIISKLLADFSLPEMNKFWVQNSKHPHFEVSSNTGQNVSLLEEQLGKLLYEKYANM